MTPIVLYYAATCPVQERTLTAKRVAAQLRKVCVREMII